MSEYIVELDSKHSVALKLAFAEEMRGGDFVHGKVVRCMDCKYYYEAEEYHPQGNYDRRCCKYFGTYDDEVEPDGFCAWGERREP